MLMISSGLAPRHLPAGASMQAVLHAATGLPVVDLPHHRVATVVMMIVTAATATVTTIATIGVTGAIGTALAARMTVTLV